MEKHVVKACVKVLSELKINFKLLHIIRKDKKYII